MARTLITSDNLSPLVVILTWFWCIVSVLCFGARAATKAIFSRSLSIEDYSSSLSVIFNILQSVAVTIRTRNGLGKHVSSLRPGQISAYEKATYAANILYIMTMYLSELSVLLLIKYITPHRRDRQIILGTRIILILWTVIGVIVSATECGSPRPWDYSSGHCIDGLAFWNYVEVMNFLINFGLVALPIFILSKVHMSLLRRVYVSLMFALRITVCAASIAKLVYWNRALPTSDSTFVIWTVTVCTQMIQCLSLTSFCALYLRPLFETMDSGFIRTDDLRRKGQTTHEGSFDLSAVSGTYSSASNNTKDKRASRVAKTMQQISQMGNNETSVTALPPNEALGDRWEAGSQTSQARMIRETRTFEVERRSVADEEEGSQRSQ